MQIAKQYLIIARIKEKTMENISIIILEELNDQNYILKCTKCNGSGRNKYYNSEICSFCNGRGKIMVKLEGSLPFVKCAACDGSGSLLPGDKYCSISCTACLGVGAQPITGKIKLIK